MKTSTEIREASLPSLPGKSAVVVGASRGLGRGVAEAFDGAGASVVAIARDREALSDLAARSRSTRIEAMDATDPSAPNDVLTRYPADVLALVAGASPIPKPLQEQTWDDFSLNWHADVRLTFQWVREALLLPLRPGSVVLIMSSGAALAGSPLSGGYAGAKATIRFITQYAEEESQRGRLGITFKAILPRLTPATGLGRPAVAAYAARSGVSEEQYLRQLGEPVSPQIAGAAFVSLASDLAESEFREYILTGTGLQPIRHGEG